MKQEMMRKRYEKKRNGNVGQISKPTSADLQARQALIILSRSNWVLRIGGSFGGDLCVLFVMRGKKSEQERHRIGQSMRNKRY